MQQPDARARASAIPVHLGRPIHLGLPFTMYEFRLAHRLLDNLQAVSRFLVRALGAGASIETIGEVTALSRETLDAQYEYLRQQGYLTEEFALADLGRQMVELEAVLPMFVARVGVDGFCGKNIFVLPPDVEPAPACAADVRVPHSRFINYFVQQAAVSGALLRDDGADLLKFLKYFWPEYGSLFDGQLRYLDYKLVPLPGHEAEEITVDVGDQQWVAVERLHHDDIGVVLPVLDIERSYSSVDGYPWQACVRPSDRYCVELFGNTELAAHYPYVDRADDPRRTLPVCADGAAPLLPSAVVPMGVGVRYQVGQRYLHLRVQGSLMSALEARYRYLILKDDDA
jgi:hypothetical protein